MYDLQRRGFIYVKGKMGSFVSFLLSHSLRRRLIFYDSEDEALRVKEEMEFLTQGDVHIFPVFSERVFEKEDEMKRTAFLSRMISDDSFVGLYPYNAINHPLSPPETISRNRFIINFGDTLFMEDLTDYLERNGYEPATLVREEGEYAKRGSIIDVYSTSQERPVRVEFLGDQVLSIRFFDTSTQRSFGELESIDLTPVKAPRSGEATLVDYMGEGMIFAHEGIERVLQTFRENGGLGKVEKELRKRLASGLNVDISGVVGVEGGLVIEALSNEDLKRLFEADKAEIFRRLAEKLKGEWTTRRYMYVFANSTRQGERLREIFGNYGVVLPLLNGMSYRMKEKEWGIVTAPLRRGFRTDDIIFITEEDILGPKKRVVKRRWEGFDEFLNSFKDLTVGQWVVHVEHGIGVYGGITHLKIDGSMKDFLLIEYQDGDRLYVPIDSLHLVQKYIGGEKQRPKVDKLGSNYWRNTKTRVKRYVEDMAGELIKLYAERELARRHVYPPEDELFREMESRFEYEETEGQAQAIEDVLGDLKGSKPMDRLVCGDVGFGKTEVALRAAFKVILENKQVALLVPTTILAQQHHKTFCERLRDYPVVIEMLSRFRTREEQRKIVEGIGKGSVDMVIGTHRILQKDLSFKDLGLLIIDEEHRFGVSHKEKLRQMKKNIDVLTLTATPIPRTLYMATSGIRDLSIINTPPLDRLAVKTYVVKFRDDLVRDAISREIQRGGQVFFVHNFIHNIGVVYEHLKGLVPQAGIAVAHGRMDGKELEKIMLDFIDRKYDVLLSTNIIESGLDISNVNTILINNAHRMGLADLYQLRGRVGRSGRQAFAYLLVPKDEVLAKDSLLRLKIIEELTGLGSGFHIANYDLEIRGVGNLLGKEQSGNINLIGFELYCDLLEQAIKELKNKDEPVKEEVVTELNIPMDAYIPDTYIEDPGQKLLAYKRLSGIKGEEELGEMGDELRDRYGEIPPPLRNLLDAISLRIALSRLKVRKLEYTAKGMVFHVTHETPVDMKRLLKAVRSGKGRTKLLPDGKIIVGTEGETGDLISRAKNVLMDIFSL